MSRITQTIRMPDTGPTADEIIDAALSTAQDAMEVLGPDASALMRAKALVGLGHPCWMAKQHGRQFVPISEGGGLFHDEKFRTTTNIEKLGRLAGDTVFFDILLPSGNACRCVYDRQFKRCGPFVQHIEVRNNS